MENLNQILEAYGRSRLVHTLAKEFGKNEPARVLMEGSTGSQDAFVLTALSADTCPHQLIIANDKEDAAYTFNDLVNLSGGKQIYFLPDSFKKPLSFEQFDNGHSLQRTEIINQISADQRPFTIVAYPESIFEKVVAPGLLKEQQIRIGKGEGIDLDFLIEILVKYGFERVDFVFEPGQFSIRGGIIDIFSYGNEWPYRVELFDEEVESIRLFDPLDQLSIKEIGSVNIVPDVNKKFSQSEKCSLFTVLPPETLVCMRDIEFVMDRIQRCVTSFSDFAKLYRSKVEDESLQGFIRQRAFLLGDEFIDSLEGRHLLLFKKPSFDMKGLSTIGCRTSPQPEFNKNFRILIEHLRANQKDGIRNVIFTDNVKQIERFYAIFEDLHAEIEFLPIAKSIHRGFLDLDLRLACYTDHQIFQRFHRYRLKRGFSKSRALNYRLLRALQPGDFVTHIDHGVGRYSGLEKIDINGHIQESVRLIYKNNDILYVSINSLHKIAKFVGKEGKPPQLNKLGSDAWQRLKRKTKKKVKDIAQQLIRLYAKRKASQGFSFPPDSYLQNELEASFLYEDTPDQFSATRDVKDDMTSPQPMDRLICGDVGFGKTEVAIRGAFKAIVGGKQVAVLVPTTILALQHYKTFSDRLKEFSIKVDYINRFRSQREKRKIYEKLAEGEIDVIIGTHSLLNKNVKFKDLGLLVIDEEQKFGVSAKEKLRSLRVNVDTLTLTATPIPRTLQFSLMAARDMSILRTAPPNRQPIHTEVRIFNEELIRESIHYEINRGGQVYFVHNRVKSLPDIHALLERLCPDVDIVRAHGQMEPKELEQTLIEFIDRRHDLLLCTNIIETGLDIPNVNTIIINNAHQFGMSDLHQLRGRVGRSNKKAFCYLFSPPMSVLTREARKRLQTLEEFSDLGSGFHIAMRDLDIRGAGNLLGAEQSGFIADIGYETYQKILEEAIRELKEEEFKEVFRKEWEEKSEFVRDVTIDTDVEMMIPDEYVNNIQERLNLYRELDEIETEEGIEKFKQQLSDRFGPLPKRVMSLFDGLRLRWLCRRLGFQRLIFKKGKLRCYFLENAQSPYYETEVFKKILAFLSEEGEKRGIRLKQSATHLIMIVDRVPNLKSVHKTLRELDASIRQQPVAAVSG